MCDVRYGDGGGGGGGFLKQYLFSEEWEHVSHLVFFSNINRRIRKL